MSRTIPGARLLSVNAYGHTSLQSSLCADTYTADHLVNGALPPAGTVCQADRKPFDPLPMAAGDAAAARTVVVTATLPTAVRGTLARALR